jgi:hypothetical protein
MTRALVVKALIVSALLVVMTAGSAVAGSRSVRDARGDASAPRWDMTQVKLTNSAQIAGRAVVVNLRPGAGYFAVRFGQPGNPDDLFTASSRIRKDGSLHNKLHIFGELIDQDIPCHVSASWNFTADAVRVSFPRSCLQGLHGPLRMQAGLGPTPRFHSQDHSRSVRVLQR